MRTLKRTLCLVLVLVMMVGLCAIGASAVAYDDYKDKAEIQHPEAVKVLTAINVLQGDDKGTFRPTDPLTRAESAAFFTRLCASTGAGTSTFTDMGAYAWAQPYVAYCQAAGIVAGNGDGTFNPGGNTSTVAWAKMCLCALGYDPVREGLVGDQWEVNTIKLVNTLDLAKGIATLDWNGPISRDDAAQFAYNTLTETMQEYVGGADIHVSTGDGTNVDVTGYVPPTDVSNGSYDYTGVVDHDMQFCENYFPNLKMAAGVGDNTFGFSNNIWFMGANRKDNNLTKDKIIASETADHIMKVYDTNLMVSDKQLYADGALNALYNELEVIVNGYTIDWAFQPNKTNGASFPFAGIPGSSTIGGVLRNFKGATIYLLDTDDEGDPDYGIADTLIVKLPYLAKVSAVTPATASADRSITLKTYIVNAGLTDSVTLTYTTNDYAKGDMLLVYPQDDTDTEIMDGDPVLAVAAPATANGTLTKVTITGGNASALTVGGVGYSVGSPKTAALGPDGYVVGTTQDKYAVNLNTGTTVYLSNGVILGLQADSVSYADYIFALAQKTNTDALGSTATIGYVKQDGTTAITNRAATSNIGGTDGDIYLWATVSDTGVFKDSGMTVDEAPTGGKISSAQPKLSASIIADAKTTFVIKNEKGVYKVYNGIGSLPTYSGITTKLYALIPSAGAHAAVVYVDLKGATPATETSTMIYLTSNAPFEKVVISGKEYYNFNAIVDGEKKVVTATSTYTESGVALAAGLVVPTYDASGYMTKFEWQAANWTGTTSGNTILANGAVPVGKLAYADGVLDVDGTVYTVTGGTKIYSYKTITGVFEELEADDLDLLNAATVTLVAASKTDRTLKTIYVTQLG